MLLCGSVPRVYRGYVLPPFIELIGGSGAAYRFRNIESGLSPAGGNFVYLREVEGKLSVVCCGKARSLGEVALNREWYKDEQSQPTDKMFLRLNAVGKLRDAEHEDLLEGLPRPFVIYEFI